MGLCSVEFWLRFVTFERARRELNVLPIPGLLVFVCVGLVWVKFFFSFVFNCANQADL